MRHFWRAFASTAENWRENSKISFFHYLRSLRDSLAQFWILNFYFFKNSFCFFTSKFLNWGTVTLFAYLNWVTFHFKSRYFRKDDLWNCLAKPNLSLSFLCHFHDALPTMHGYWLVWVGWRGGGGGELARQGGGLSPSHHPVQILLWGGRLGEIYSPYLPLPLTYTIFASKDMLQN